MKINFLELSKQKVIVQMEIVKYMITSTSIKQRLLRKFKSILVKKEYLKTLHKEKMLLPKLNRLHILI
jgi:hypothetical protein